MTTFADTSIGISIEQLKKCANTLKKNHDKSIKFRALYTEKDESAFSKLESYLAKHTTSEIELSCLKGDYTRHIN